MGRNKREKKPLGFGIGEVWGNALELPRDTMAGKATRYVYSNAGPGANPMIVRVMMKFEELESNDPKVRERAVLAFERVARAKEYGCKVILCIDWHNTAQKRGDYHQRQHFPKKKSIARWVKDLIIETNPWAVQVANEYWYLKGNQDMRAKEYREKVFEYADGCRAADWDGLLIASNYLEDRKDHPRDLWVWDVVYDNCAEGYHNFILHGPDGPTKLAAGLADLAYAKRGLAVGWVWKLICDETSPVNTSADINSMKGAEMMQVMLEHYRHFKLPCVMLTMDGKSDGTKGEWGMQTGFVRNDGNISKGAQTMLEFVGADPDPDLGGEVPPPPPPDNGNGTNPPPDGVPPRGWNTIKTPSAAYMKMTNAQVMESYLKIQKGGTGSNHMITKECAVLPEDVPSVERQLKAIIDSW